MQDFLWERLANNSGDIIDTSGKVIGQHLGIHRYTIGQRKGIELGWGPALFVIDKITTSNTLVVWPEDSPELLRKSCRLTDWVSIDTDIKFLQEKPITGKIRYRQIDIAVTLSYKEDGLVANFKEPQRAVTPGQFLVIYQGSHVIGSGIICW
jgi:tRNA-specific 2-thiouridylase